MEKISFRYLGLSMRYYIIVVFILYLILLFTINIWAQNNNEDNDNSDDLSDENIKSLMENSGYTDDKIENLNAAYEDTFLTPRDPFVATMLSFVVMGG